MEEKIKEIIAAFIKMPIEQINDSTIIDRSTTGSSILLHRLYATLENGGFIIENYWDIKDFGSLKKALNKHNSRNEKIIADDISKNDFEFSAHLSNQIQAGVGIDIEEISSMPETEDFRENDFYKMNFASSEISYCILQKNPYASLAGLFAVKEAIVKANNNYKNQPFNSIIIDHLSSGIPFYKEFQLSISHTKNLVVGIAIPKVENSLINKENIEEKDEKSNFFKKKYKSILLLSLSALAVSVVVFIIMIIYFINK